MPQPEPVSDLALPATAHTSVEFGGLGRLGTVANWITVVRTVASVIVAGVAISTDQPKLLALAYAIYWLGDMLDGFAARRLHQETRLGAVHDIISDRACTSILIAGLVMFFPHLTVVAIAFFLSFMVLDTILSLAFLCFDVISPNYFFEVDRQVYNLNWSPVAKATNTAAVILLAVFVNVWIALALTLVLIGIKIWSGLRVLTLINQGR